jgi:RNA polymerase sigma-70 factor, ECF subfamily
MVFAAKFSTFLSIYSRDCRHERRVFAGELRLQAAWGILVFLGTPAGVRTVKASNGEERDLRNREFVRLLAEHERRLDAYVHALIPLWQDAEDVLQNTKLRLWEQFDSFRPEADFGVWAVTIAGYMVRTHRTLRQRQRVCFSDDLLEKISQQVAVSFSSRDDRTLALVECVRALNSASRRLLRLFCTGQQKIKDIARDLGQTPSATYSALYRIRWSLFDCVKRHLDEPQEP